MIYYDRIVFLKELMSIKQMNQNSVLDICHYWYFLGKGFNDWLIRSSNLNDMAILNINNVDYCRIITGINKSEAVNLSQNTDKMGHHKIVNFCFSYVKNG